MLKRIFICILIISECIVCFAQENKNNFKDYKINNINKNNIKKNKSSNNIQKTNSIINNPQVSNNKKVIRILSLDGGGTRGYIQAKFLELLCKEFKIDNLGKYFELIVGTSIGGINAVVLANGMSPQDLIKFFREKSPWIFTIRNKKDIFSKNASIPSNKPSKMQMLYMISTGNPFYKSVSDKSNYGDARLIKELQMVFGNKSLNQLNTKILLTSYDFKTNTPILFSNIELNNIPSVFTNTKIVDAVMATTSFPIYFPSIKLNNNTTENYKTSRSNIIELEAVDGGLFQCNPSTLAFIAAKNIYPNAKKYCLLSIGTGIKQNSIDFNKNKGIIYNLLPVKYTKIWNIFIQNSKYTSDLLLKSLSNDPILNLDYYRFDVKLDNNRDCSLDTSTSDFFDYLDKIVEEKYKKDKEEIHKFINDFKDIKTNI